MVARLSDGMGVEEIMKSRQELESAAAALSFDGRAVINGKRIATEKTSPNISPVTAKSLTEVSECG